MRIIHTSDWHLGKTLETRQRLPEQEQFLDLLCDIVSSEGADMVVVAGDIFDGPNPPAAAEELYYDALERLADGGQRAVVVIAGNHDNPERIRAANPLAARHGISLIGYPSEDLGLGGPEGGARRVRSGPGWLEIYCPKPDETAFIVTLAYPSESRLNQVFGETLDDRIRQMAYSDRVGELLTNSIKGASTGAIRMVLGHLFTAGGRESDSERQIQLGGALAVHPQAFASADYIALGHLHRPQQVVASAVPCRYSGSPLAFSFSEVDHQKEVVLLDVEAGARCDVRSIPLTCGKALKRWLAATYEEALKWCDDPHNTDFWVDLEITRDQPLSPSEISALRAVHPGLVHIRWRSSVQPVSEEERRVSELPLIDRFKLFCERKGVDASQELLDLFLELVNEDGKEVSSDETPQA